MSPLGSVVKMVFSSRPLLFLMTLPATFRMLPVLWVLLQLHHVGAGVVLLEVQDVLDVGATPGIDGLIVVPHDHDALVPGGNFTSWYWTVLV